MRYFIEQNKNKIKIYQQISTSLPIEFKIGNDNDIELIMNEEKNDPETTEQIINKVFYKSENKPP